MFFEIPVACQTVSVFLKYRMRGRAYFVFHLHKQTLTDVENIWKHLRDSFSWRICMLLLQKTLKSFSNHVFLYFLRISKFYVKWSVMSNTTGNDRKCIWIKSIFVNYYINCFGLLLYWFTSWKSEIPSVNINILSLSPSERMSLQNI